MCRVRVDGVEVDAAIQDERAIKLATAYEGPGQDILPYPQLVEVRPVRLDVQDTMGRDHP